MFMVGISCSSQLNLKNTSLAFLCFMNKAIHARCSCLQLFYSLKNGVHVHVKVVTGGNTKCGFLLYANLNHTALLYWICDVKLLNHIEIVYCTLREFDMSVQVSSV